MHVHLSVRHVIAASFYMIQTQVK